MTPQTWDCTDARLSLGVYVLGAIDPAERALVDAHLATCRDCRDELAGLAGRSATETARAVQNLLVSFSAEELRDDLTILVARVTDPPESYSS